MWVLLVVLGWVLLELIMARLAGESGPEFHSITTLQLSTSEMVDGRQSTVDGKMDEADSR